jgi:hypothetical protein
MQLDDAHTEESTPNEVVNMVRLDATNALLMLCPMAFLGLFMLNIAFWAESR